MLRSRGVRVAVPALVVVPLVWLMVGCLYVPWFERKEVGGAKRDFRDLSGKSPADPIVDGRITLEQVTRLLGPPAAQSPNGRVIAYTLTTRHGVWIEPLCLNVTPGGQYLHAVGLRFDGRGMLERHKFVTVDVAPQLGVVPGLPADRELERAWRYAMTQIDQNNGVVPPVRPDPWTGRGRPARAGVREAFSVAGPGDPLTD